MTRAGCMPGVESLIREPKHSCNGQELSHSKEHRPLTSTLSPIVMFLYSFPRRRICLPRAPVRTSRRAKTPFAPAPSQFPRLPTRCRNRMCHPLVHPRITASCRAPIGSPQETPPSSNRTQQAMGCGHQPRPTHPQRRPCPIPRLRLDHGQ